MSTRGYCQYETAEVLGINAELGCTEALAEFIGKYHYLTGLGVLGQMTGLSRHRLTRITSSVGSGGSSEVLETGNPRIVRIDDLSITRRYQDDKGRKGLKGHLVLSGAGFTEDAFQQGIHDTGFLDMIAGTTRADAVRLFRRNVNCDTVQYVTLDLSQTLISAAYEACPDAIVVADKFHVLKLVTAAFDKVGSAQQKALKKGERQSLQRARNYMKRPPKNLSDAEKREMVTWLVRLPQLHRAYEIRRVFFELFELDISPQEARTVLERWLDFLSEKGSVGTAFRTVKRTVKKYLTEICAYFDRRLTNAPAEALNRRIKDIYRSGGVRTLEGLIERVRAGHGYGARQALYRISSQIPKKRQPLWNHIPAQNTAIWVRPVKARDGELPFAPTRPDGMEMAADRLANLSIAAMLWPEVYH